MITIRKENKIDYEKVFELNALAFGQDNEANLVELLRKSESFVPELSIVAINDDELIGHILFTKIKIINDIDEFESLALAPMAVHQQHQNLGIGSKLVKYGLQKAKELGFVSVIVLGHKEYYPRFGFEPAINWNIKAPFDVPSEVFMGMELKHFGLKNVSGIVQYPKEFEIV